MDDELRFPIAFGCLPVWDRGGSGARHTAQSYWGVLFLAAVLSSLSHPPPPLPYSAPHKTATLVLVDEVEFDDFVETAVDWKIGHFVFLALSEGVGIDPDALRGYVELHGTLQDGLSV
jgi:hypothetical protein